MKLYDVGGKGDYKRLSPEHAEQIGAKEVAGGLPMSQTPKQSETKQRWIDYAVSQGADVDDLDGLTKAELIEQYG